MSSNLDNLMQRAGYKSERKLVAACLQANISIDQLPELLDIVEDYNTQLQFAIGLRKQGFSNGEVKTIMEARKSIIYQVKASVPPTSIHNNIPQLFEVADFYMLFLKGEPADRLAAEMVAVKDAIGVSTVKEGVYAAVATAKRTQVYDIGKVKDAFRAARGLNPLHVTNSTIDSFLR